MAWLKQLWTRFQRAALPAKIGVVVGALVITCCVCGTSIVGLGALVNGGGAPTAQATSTDTSNVATSQPTATAVAATQATATTADTVQPTATTKPLGPAVLGAPGQAFIAAYGQPTTQGSPSAGDLHFKPYPGVATDFLIVDEGRYLASNGGANNAFSIVVAPPPGQDWSVSAAHTACQAFAPADAHFVKQVIAGSGGVTDGVDAIYTSKTLAPAFAASDFVDANQNPVAAGSFDILYLYASSSDTSHYASCQVMVGEQQTTG